MFFFVTYFNSDSNFYSAGVYLVGCIIYWMWASGEVQPWAIEKPIEGNKEKSEKEFGHTNHAIEMKDE